MIEAVFISDLHLHPQYHAIQERFNAFIQWVTTAQVQKIYILGDMFHAWPGDDSIDAWSSKIAKQVAALAENGVSVFYMHGNRDFLVGPAFATLANMTLLKEPHILTLGGKQVLCTHGDRYCIKDKAHQRFRKLTRNAWFPKLFLTFPLRFRHRIVRTVRQHSQTNTRKSAEIMDTVVSEILSHLHQSKAHIVVHGHTHKPGMTVHQTATGSHSIYVLSDWDDNPQILCYDNAIGFYFTHVR